MLGKITDLRFHHIHPLRCISQLIMFGIKQERKKKTDKLQEASVSNTQIKPLQFAFWLQIYISNHIEFSQYHISNHVRSEQTVLRENNVVIYSCGRCKSIVINGIRIFKPRFKFYESTILIMKKKTSLRYITRLRARQRF